MLYLWPQAGSMRSMHSRFGVITTAAHGCVPTGIKKGRLWAFDNECFRRPFDYDRWLAHWHRLFPYSKRCLFVVVPISFRRCPGNPSLWQDWHASSEAAGLLLTTAHAPRRDLRSPPRWTGVTPLPDEAAGVHAGSTNKAVRCAASVIAAWTPDVSTSVVELKTVSLFRRLAERLTWISFPARVQPSVFTLHRHCNG